MSRFQLWRTIEENFCRRGELPAETNANHRVFHSIVRTADAKLGEGLVLEGHVDPLLALRAMVHRGRLGEADILAGELTTGAEGSEQSLEILLEKARIAAMNGDWKTSAALCDAGLAHSELAPVSRLTLFQVRSLARFEMAQMLQAIDDLDRMEALASLFPNSPSAFYGKVLRTRIHARDRGAEAGLTGISALWATLGLGGEASLDRVLTLVRAELDIRRTAGQVHPQLSVASYLIARKTGEGLYESLAIVEAARSGVTSLRNYFAPLEPTAIAQFERVRRFVAELASPDRPEPISVSAASLLAATSRAEDADFVFSPEIQWIIFLRSKRAVDLETGGMLPFAELPQVYKAVQALADGPLGLEEFFNAVWGNTRYSSEIHDTAISSLLYRARRKAGLAMRVSRGKVHLEHTLVIG